MIPPIQDPTPPRTRGRVLHKAASVYDWLAPAMMLFQEGRINRSAIRFLDLQPGDIVLDVGCATGGTTIEVARHLNGAKGGLVVGIDASAEMIAQARKKTEGKPCRFDLGVAEGLPYENASFDKAVSTMFFHHLCLEDKLAALRQVHRVLRPEGRFVIADVDTPTTILGRLFARSGQWLFDQPEIGENIEGKLPGLFLQAGFSYTPVAHALGYITTYVLHKAEPQS
jgi:ubiquinone/menaquinone biosynthesis C-methylase UbiE